MCNITWYKIRVRGARPGLAVVSRALVSGREQDVAVTDSRLGSVGVTVGPFGPVGPALWNDNDSSSHKQSPVHQDKRLRVRLTV